MNDELKPIATFSRPGSNEKRVKNIIRGSSVVLRPSFC